MIKPPWADEVVELTVEEADALVAMGHTVYWDKMPWYDSPAGLCWSLFGGTAVRAWMKNGVPYFLFMLKDRTE